MTSPGDRAGWRREDVSYSIDGSRIAAFLYLPDRDPAATRWPAVVTGPGFAGVKEMLIEHYAAALAAAGIACLSIDYRHWGASGGEPRQDLDPAGQVADLIAGLDYLQRRDDIDATRLGTWGTSMAGGHAVTLAARDPRIRAAVAIIPFLRSPPMRTDQFWLLPALAVDALRRAVGRAPGTVPVFAERRDMRAVMTTDGGWDWMQGVSAAAPTYRNRVTVRSLARLAGYRPDRQLSRIAVPIRFIAALDDSITPAEPIRKASGQVAGPADLVAFPGSHFELFGEHLAETVECTVQWFSRYLRA